MSRNVRIVQFLRYYNGVQQVCTAGLFCRCLLRSCRIDQCFGLDRPKLYGLTSIGQCTAVYGRCTAGSVQGLYGRCTAGGHSVRQVYSSLSVSAPVVVRSVYGRSVYGGVADGVRRDSSRWSYVFVILLVFVGWSPVGIAWLCWARASASPNTLPSNGPSATASGVWEFWQNSQTMPDCSEVVD